MIYVNAFFYEANGRITSRTTCPSTEVALLGPNVIAAEFGLSAAWTDNTHWVAGGELVPRPDMDPEPSALTVTANGTDQIVITALPAEGTLHVDGLSQVPWTDGQVSFSTTTPGVHHLRLESFPYRDATLEVTAT